MNKHKEFIKDHAFSNAFSNALTKHSGISDEICPRLLTILAEEFSLNTEGFSNVFQHSDTFHQWCSESPIDREFGAIGSFFTADLSGKNTYAFQPYTCP